MFYEDDNDVLVAQFGTGDIIVMPGHIEGEPKMGVVSLVDNCGKCGAINQPIMPDDEWAEWIKKNGIRTDTDMNTVMRLVFSDVRAIDTVIWALGEAKAKMTGDTITDERPKCTEE